jgi:zinc protease
MAALEVLAAILSTGDSSRLHQRVVRRDRVGVAAGGQLFKLEDPGLFFVLGIFLSPDQADKLKAALLDEVARMTREKVSADELTKAKNQLAAQLVFGLQTVDGLAVQIGSSKVVRGDAKAWIDDYDRYQKVTAEDVQRVAQAYLKSENLTMLVVPPKAQDSKTGGGK